MDYGFMNAPVSQAKPILGREKEIGKNLASGYAFKTDPFQALKRWLLTGSMGNAFYQGKQEMTEENVKIFLECAESDPGKVADLIIYASKKGVSVHTPIYALVWLSTRGKPEFRKIFNEVIRTASHLYEFFSYLKGVRGKGTVIHKAVKSWLDSKSVQELEYQFLKYQNRYDFSVRDILRIVKPIGKENGLKDNLYGYFTEKKEISHSFLRIRTYEQLKVNLNEADTVRAINEQNLTHEMIPANIKRTKAIWEALFNKMPVGASIRNLGQLTEKGLFNKIENIEILRNKLKKENLQKAYIHPIVLASAYHIYSNNGNIGRSKLIWKSEEAVCDILETAIENCFDIVEPINKRILHGLDASGSMWSDDLQPLWLTPGIIGAIMARASIAREPYYNLIGFDGTLYPIHLTKKTAFRDILNPQSQVYKDATHNATDCALPIKYAIDTGQEYDAIIMWTDGQSWAGNTHVSVATKKYQKKYPNCKIIINYLVPYGEALSLSDPTNPRMYDIMGFTAETPKLINMIVRGEI